MEEFAHASASLALGIALGTLFAVIFLRSRM